MKMFQLSLLCLLTSAYSAGHAQPHDGEDSAQRQDRKWREKSARDEEARRQSHEIEQAHLAAQRAEAKAQAALTALAKQAAIEQQRLDAEQRKLAEAAAEEERIQQAQESDALARGELESYIARVEYYQRMRAAANRPPSKRAEETSIIQAKLGDGRHLVVANGDKQVFATKAEAETFIAQVKAKDREKETASAKAEEIRVSQIESETAASYDRVLARYPWLADKQGSFHRELDAYISALLDDPASDHMFTRTDWPETVSLRWGVERGYLRKDGSMITK